jgi:hypothetical protein
LICLFVRKLQQFTSFNGRHPFSHPPRELPSFFPPSTGGARGGCQENCSLHVLLSKSMRNSKGLVGLAFLLDPVRPAVHGLILPVIVSPLQSLACHLQERGAEEACYSVIPAGALQLSGEEILQRTAAEGIPMYHMALWSLSRSVSFFPSFFDEIQKAPRRKDDENSGLEIPVKVTILRDNIIDLHEVCKGCYQRDRAAWKMGSGQGSHQAPGCTHCCPKRSA